MKALAPFFREARGGYAIIKDEHHPRCRPVCEREVDGDQSEHAYYGGHLVAESAMNSEDRRLICSAPGGLKLARLLISAGSGPLTYENHRALLALARQVVQVAATGSHEPPKQLLGDMLRRPVVPIPGVATITLPEDLDKWMPAPPFAEHLL